MLLLVELSAFISRKYILRDLMKKKHISDPVSCPFGAFFTAPSFPRVPPVKYLSLSKNNGIRLGIMIFGSCGKD